ncbi:hypothetical protein Rs2_13328 [Raphanus sativus]|uniref:Uncharacterized protein LOC130511809 n=1 Tax=Raphanus sativus TaxID=3726 RepID=A0A9W3DPD1_RAPSA|nr:uncharacterized protein LOC130511809 [Raphanus sativus]KAJ4899377.1 hypothetical protein Rs2_13328 [Raphanus sativus]
MEKDSNFTDLNNEGILKTLEQIEEKASSFLNLSVRFDYMVKSLEKKKEEGLRVVEAREKEVALLEDSLSEKSRVLEEKEMDFDMIQVLEASLLRLVIETQTELVVRKKLEDVTSECERKEEEARLVFESIREKLCGLEKAEEGFDVKQRVEMERLEARKKELSSLDEAIKVMHAELKRKEEKFELKQREEADKWRKKSKDLEIKEKKLEEMLKELELKKHMELEERSKLNAETRKRSNHEGTLTPPAKKHKSEEADLAPEGTVCKDKSEEDPKPLTCPDTKFNDVGKSISSFDVDQVWALYDSRDDMPRIYAQVRRIFSAQLSLQVTLLEHVKTTEDEKSVISSACGRFEYGDTEIKSHLMFAHEMHHTKCGKNVIVNPRKGETWALFRDWDISWKSHSDVHEPPYRYDLVEVITEFDDQLGISVVYMGRDEGFESHGLIKNIYPGEMQRFSHKVASVNWGEEKGEVVETSIQGKDCVKAPTVETQEGSTEDQPITIE